MARHLGNFSCISNDSTTFGSQGVSSIKVTLATSITSPAVECKLNDWENPWKGEGENGGSVAEGGRGVWGMQGNARWDREGDRGAEGEATQHANSQDASGSVPQNQQGNYIAVPDVTLTRYRDEGKKRNGE